jgi:hypothetical protein
MTHFAGKTKRIIAATALMLAITLTLTPREGQCRPPAPQVPTPADYFYDTLQYNVRRYPAPLFILKTNLIYDIAITPHIGLEVPVGEWVSLSGEFMRGWWLNSDWSFCWQLEAAAFEGRYWFTPALERHQTGGWFAAAFVQAGFYDFQFETTQGVQGKFIMAGLSGGYLFPLSRQWSLEFTLGLAYLSTYYRRYTVEPTITGHELVALSSLIHLQGAPYPLKAGVQLQWNFNRPKIKRWKL